MEVNEQCTVKGKRLRTVGLEVFKALNNPDFSFMEEIFHRTKWLTHRPNNMQVNVHKTAKYGDKSLRTLGPHISNSLPEHMKAETNFIKFTEYITQWFGPICKCIFVSILTNWIICESLRESYDYDLRFDPFTENGFTFFVFSFSVKYVNTVFIYHS